MTHPLARLSRCPALCLFPSLIILIVHHTFIPISQILATRILSSLETDYTEYPRTTSYQLYRFLFQFSFLFLVPCGRLSWLQQPAFGRTLIYICLINISYHVTTEVRPVLGFLKEQQDNKSKQWSQSKEWICFTDHYLCFCTVIFHHINLQF